MKLLAIIGDVSVTACFAAAIWTDEVMSLPVHLALYGLLFAAFYLVLLVVLEEM